MKVLVLGAGIIGIGTAWHCNGCPAAVASPVGRQQWRWGLMFLAQCNDRAFERNVTQLVAP